MANYPLTDSVTTGGQDNLIFRKRLKVIDGGLGSKDVQKMAFLCRDFTDIPLRDLDNFKRGVQLFSALEKADLLRADDVSLVLELLDVVRRRDLLRKAKELWPESSIQQLRLSSYRKLLLDIANNTTSSELLEMTTLVDLPYSSEEITHTLQFLVALEKENIISSSDVTPLIEILDNKQNIRKVQTYISTMKAEEKLNYNSHWNLGLTQPVNPVPPDSLLKPGDFFSSSDKMASVEKQTEDLSLGNEASQATRKMPEELRNVNLVVKLDKPEAEGKLLDVGARKVAEDQNPPTDLETVSVNVQRQPDINLTGSENLPVISQGMNRVMPVEETAAVPHQSAQISLEGDTIQRSLARCYRMQHNPCGVCVIINNQKFKSLKDREGSDIDVEVLLNCFTKFNFQIVKKDNLTALQMFNLLNEIRERKDLSDHDAFVCCILTHGKLGKLAGTDGKYLGIQDDIVSLFAPEKCPDLAFKPKMFFIQACQGRELPELYNVEPDDPRPKGVGHGLVETLPNQADFLLGYATVPGYVSYRSKTDGSWYIKALVDALNSNYLEEDLISILTIVNSILSGAKTNVNTGQVPAPVTTLRKKVYFWRKENIEYL